LVILGVGAGAADEFGIIPGLVQSFPRFAPGVMLFVFLPPLLFDAAFRLDANELRFLWRPVLILAGPGVLVTAGVVAGIMAIVAGLPVPTGLVLGSVVAATDPVAVTAVFRQLRVPKRTEVIVESESLINDGVAITLYAAFVGFA